MRELERKVILALREVLRNPAGGRLEVQVYPQGGPGGRRISVNPFLIGRTKQGSVVVDVHDNLD